MNEVDHWSPIESADPEQIRDEQLAALRAQLERLMSRSPFYTEKLAAAGFELGDAASLRDLSQLPFTEKQELRDTQAEQPPLGAHAGVEMVDVERIHASSGTTGKPSYIGLTATDAARWREAVTRAYYTQGVRRDSVVAMGFGIGFFVGGLPVQQGLAAIGATVIPVGTGATERLIEASLDLGANALACTPSYAAYLADRTQAVAGIAPEAIGFKRVLVGAEPGGGIPAFRAALQDVWNATVTESVGNGDVVPIHSAECEAQNGSHFLVPDMAVMEVIDPDTAEVIDIWAQPRSEGELVFTHLDRECAALVRFRTRDHVEIRTDPCPCGRTGPRMVCVGRTDDMLLLRGVNVWPSAVKDVISEFRPRLSGQFRIALDQAGHHHDPPLHIVAEVGASSDAGADRTAIGSEVEAALRAKLIVTCAVELVDAGTFPRTETKEKLLWRRDLDPDPKTAGR